jgi:hypothetical protein
LRHASLLRALLLRLLGLLRLLVASLARLGLCFAQR